MGEFYTKTPWFFQIFVFLFKTSISLILLLLFNVLFWKKIKSPSKDKLGHYILISIIIGIMILFMNNRLTSGIRHILPLYPFLFVYISNIVNLKLRIKGLKIIFKFVLSLILLHYILTSLYVAPDYLAYFNEFTGGPKNGYKYLVLSNIDIGQDLPGLKRYMVDNNLNTIKLSYNGPIDPKEYGINYELLPTPIINSWHPDYERFPAASQPLENCSETDGIIAVSVSYLHNLFLTNKSCYDWLKKYEPVAQIGYSINIYNISKKSYVVS